MSTKPPVEAKVYAATIGTGANRRLRVYRHGL